MKAVENAIGPGAERIGDGFAHFLNQEVQRNASVDGIGLQGVVEVHVPFKR